MNPIVSHASSENYIENLKCFALEMPKVEMHVHLEGTFMPERVLAIAERNGVALPERYDNLEKLTQAYVFKDLFSFLELYSICASVLRNEQDFKELTLDYLKSAKKQGVVHAEIFVGFQLHMKNGIELATVLNGVRSAIHEAEKEYGITSSIILDIDRGESLESALALLDQALKVGKDVVIGVGLAYAENKDNPPRKFEALYRKAHAAGLRTTAHAGEAFGPEYVQEAIDVLKVDRIDHGVRSIESEAVIRSLVEKAISLTVCPKSNICLKVYKDMKHHPIPMLMKKGIVVTINSDDPAYFGGGIQENFNSFITTFHPSLDDVYLLGKNSITASFLADSKKEKLLKEIEILRSRYSAQM